MNQKTKIIFAFSIGIIFLLLVGVYSFKSIKDSKVASRWVSHTQTVIHQTQQILSACQDVETANRGYAITGKEVFLKPYYDAEKSIPEAFPKLLALTSANAAEQKLIHKLEKEVELKLQFGKKVNDTSRNQGILAAQKLILKDTGRILMDQIRQTVDQIIDIEEKQLARRQIITNDNFEESATLIILGSIFSIVAIFFSIFIFVRDYNKRLKAENETKESEYKLKQFLNALPLGVYIFDKDYVPYYANHKAKEILGTGILASASSSVSQVFKAYKKGTDNPVLREESPSFLVLQGAPSFVTEDIEIARNNTRIPLRINASPVIDSEGEITFAISVFEDITEQRNAERELIRARQLAEESSLLKEVFLANMSHEIRTPMNAIIGFSILMKETKMDVEQQEYISNISTASENLLGIINDILDISKIESGHIVIEKIHFDLEKLVKNVIAIMHHKITDSKLLLNFSIGENVPRFVLGDPTRLNQILINLINNAIKFTEKGEVKLELEFIGAADDEIILKFNVKDTGIGIPTHKLDSIFERFSQADPNTTRMYGGTGLGLSICKSLVELQGGSIGVESEQMIGSTFHFMLSFGKVQDNKKQELEIKIDKLPHLQKMHILLVEDNVLNQKLAMRVLENFGFTVELAENGKVAVEKVQLTKFDVILMDLQMPVMDGYQATNFIRNDLKNQTPIIAMTAHSLVGEKEKCMSIGMNDYVPKPFSPAILQEKILGYATATDSNQEILSGNTLVDLTYLRQLSAGSKEFEQEMIDLYLNQTPLELAILHQAIAEADFNTVKATAHKLKSSFSLMGVNENGILPWFEKKAIQQLEIEAYDSKFTELKAIFEMSKDILLVKL